jgi:hypothetical protein
VQLGVEELCWRCLYCRGRTKYIKTYNLVPHVPFTRRSSYGEQFGWGCTFCWTREADAKTLTANYWRAMSLLVCWPVQPYNSIKTYSVMRARTIPTFKNFLYSANVLHAYASSRANRVSHPTKFVMSPNTPPQRRGSLHDPTYCMHLVLF